MITKSVNKQIIKSGNNPSVKKISKSIEVTIRNVGFFSQFSDDLFSTAQSDSLNGMRFRLDPENHVAFV